MKRRLYRSRTDVMIAGVAAGMAEYLDLDVTLVRLAWVALLLTGPGLLVYLMAVLLIPVDPGETGPGGGADADPGSDPSQAPGEGESTRGESGRLGEGAPVDAGRNGVRTFGWVLILLGAVFLLNRFTGFRWDDLWPVAMILAGVYLLAGRARSPR